MPSRQRRSAAASMVSYASGHIHRAEIRDIDGILYCNDGDWVESLTALVETEEGELRIIRWADVAEPARAIVARETRLENALAHPDRD